MPKEEHLTATETDKLRRVFRKALKSLTPADLQPSSACPDSETMVSYVTGTASERVRKEINAHLAFCDTCWDDYVALVGPEKVVEIARTETSDEKVLLAKTEFSADRLSPRERQVLQLIREGGSAKDIATLLGGGLKTAESPEARIRRMPDLSPLERRVLHLISEGRSVRDIAMLLGAGVKTAKSHKDKLRHKLDLQETAGPDMEDLLS